MPDGKRRSREHWTDSMEAGPPDPPAHVHRLPKVVRLALTGLVLAVFLLLIAVGFLTVYVHQANQYVQGRGQYRDQETQRLEDQIRTSICDLLDQLPEGGLLDRPRDKYGCGPGIPFEDLPEDIQRRYQGQPSAPATTAPTPTTNPPMGAPAVPNPPRVSESYRPPN